MKPTDAVVLKEYVKACCPQQRFTEYTTDAWFDLLGDLELEDCRQAVAAVAKRQPFVAPAEIRAEVRKIRDDRLARTPLPPPPAELADDPGRYQRAVQAGVKRIADGASLHRAIAGAPLPGEPPEAWHASPGSPRRANAGRPDPREVAREQAEEARAERERREGREAS